MGNITEVSEKPNIIEVEDAGELKDVKVVQKLHADGTIDMIDVHAVGGNVEDLPKGYYTSPQFIGTVVVSSISFLGGKSLY